MKQMGIEVRKADSVVIVVVTYLNLKAEFESMDDAAKFIQSIIENVTRY